MPMWKWNILDSIPVVGHVKGVVHYATGNSEAGNRAMRESSRSSVVMGAGAVGFVAGPAGSAALGASAGALWDCAETVITDKPKGLVNNMGSIVQTSSKGEVPIIGILQTTLTVGADMLGGMGGGTIVNSATKAAGQSAAKSVGKAVAKKVTNTAVEVATVGTTRAVVVNVGNISKKYTENKRSGKSDSEQPPTTPSGSEEPPKQNPRKTSSNTPSFSGSGQQPRQNPKKTSSNTQVQPNSPWKEFFDLFKVQSLDEISINHIHIFKGIKRHQKNLLKNLLKRLLEDGSMKKVIKTLVNIMNTLRSEDITFLNFISICEFIMQYLEEQIIRDHDNQGNPPGTFIETKTDIIVRVVSRLFSKHDCTIVNIFRAIRKQIKNYTAPEINFRDIYSAIYHYFKHRLVQTGQTVYELSVKEYYTLIRRNLKIIMNTTEYQDLVDYGKEITYERYYVIYGKRLLIKIKKQGPRIVLATVFFPEYPNEKDEDGDIYINGSYYCTLQSRGKKIITDLPVMTTKVQQLIHRLEQLQEVDYKNEVKARVHHANAHAALRLIFNIGRENIKFTREEKKAVAINLVAAIRPMQINIQGHSFQYREALDTIILVKRSALQYLVDNYSKFPLQGRSVTLSTVFKQVVLTETIQILDEIIDEYHNASDSSDVDHSDRDLSGIPSSHIWWF